MSKKISIRGFPLCVMLFALCLSVEAQQPQKSRVIGYLSPQAQSRESVRDEAIRLALREHGYTEGKNIIFEYRYADGKLNRFAELAAELVRLKVDVLVTNGSPPTRAAKEATSRIPIVMTQDADSVGSGHVLSLARPGGNITGLSNLSPEVSAKRLELLKETIPKLSRVVVFGTAAESMTEVLNDIELAAKEFAVKLQYLDVQRPDDLARAFQATQNRRAEAILVLQSGVINSLRKQVLEFARKNRIPAIYYAPEWAQDGGLMSYSANIVDLFRRAAIYVDKILKGANPAELPVEQPTKFELVINLQTAKQIGLTIPPNVLARADKVIK